MEKNKLATYIVATLVVVLVGGYYLTTAANAAVPGDALFPLDRALESIQRVVTISEDSRVDLELQILEERNEELGGIQEEGVDEDMETAMDATEAQQERLLIKVGDYSGDDKEEEQIKEQAQEQLQIQIEEMEKIQDQYKEGGKDEAAGKVEASIERVKDTYEKAYAGSNK